MLIKKESLDRFVNTLETKPVIINHQDVTVDNVNEIEVGRVHNVWYNKEDGWYWCDGVITNQKALDLIDKGWSVSCSYNVSNYSDKGGTENNIKYDMEFLDGDFTHLAIVKNPRYEGADIVVVNSKKGDDNGRWITVKGNHIFIREGETPKEATERFLKDKQEREEWFKEQQKEKQDKKDQKDDRSDLKGKYEDGDFDEAEAIKDIVKVKEMGLKTTEEIAEHLGLDEDEVRVLEEKAKSKEEDKDLDFIYKSKEYPQGIVREFVSEEELQKGLKDAGRHQHISDELEETIYERIKDKADGNLSKQNDLLSKAMDEVEGYSNAYKQTKEKSDTTKGEEDKGKSADPQVGDEVTFDTNWRGYKAKINTGTIVGKEKEMSSKSDVSSDWLYKVKLKSGKHIYIKKEAIDAATERKADNSLVNTIAEAMAEVIAENIK